MRSGAPQPGAMACPAGARKAASVGPALVLGARGAHLLAQHQESLLLVQQLLLLRDQHQLFLRQLRAYLLQLPYASPLAPPLLAPLVLVLAPGCLGRVARSLPRLASRGRGLGGRGTGRLGGGLARAAVPSRPVSHCIGSSAFRARRRGAGGSGPRLRGPAAARWRFRRPGRTLKHQRCRRGPCLLPPTFCERFARRGSGRACESRTGRHARRGSAAGGPDQGRSARTCRRLSAAASACHSIVLLAGRGLPRLGAHHRHAQSCARPRWSLSGRRSVATPGTPQLGILRHASVRAEQASRHASPRSRCCYNGALPAPAC